MERVQIKQFETKQEVIEFVEMYNDLDQRSIHDHDELADMDKRIQKFETNQFIDSELSNYMILDEEDRFIGTIGFRRLSPFELSFGYRLLKHEYRNKGYMTEAVNKFLKIVFTNMPSISRITLEINEKNIGSIRVAEKCGFVKEGVKRKAYMLRGEVVDFYIYGLLKEEWNK